MMPEGWILLRPDWLWAVPVVLLLGILLARRQTGLSAWNRAVDPHLMPALRRLGHLVPGSGRRNLMPGMAAALLAFCLSGPATEQRHAGSWRNLQGHVLVMDLSPSVTDSGYLPETLSAAQYVAGSAGSASTALVVYAGDAYVASTFTNDPRTLAATIALLDAETVPDAGSRPARGIEVARDLMTDAMLLDGHVVLVSDGGGVGEETFEQIGRLVEEGSRFSALAVPAADGSSQGMEALSALVEHGGGTMASILDPGSVADEVAAATAGERTATAYKTLQWTDLGRYLLLLGLLPVLFMFRRRA